MANIAGRVIDDEGRIISAHGLRRQSRDGTTEYRDAGGAWQSLGSVEQAQRTYGPRNMSAYQQKMAYAMRKATTQEEQDLVEETFARTAQSWGMSANEALSEKISSKYDAFLNVRLFNNMKCFDLMNEFRHSLQK